MKKSKLSISKIISFFRWHKKFAIRILVDRKWWTQSNFSDFQTRRSTSWNNNKRHQILRERDIFWWEKNSHECCPMLGLAYWLQNWCFWKDNNSQIMWFKNCWVELVLRKFSKWNEEHFHWRIEEVWEKSFRY